MGIPRSSLLGVIALAAFPVANAACLPSCDVGATAFGYAPAAVAIESGDNVTWTTLDLDAHTATSSAFCLNVPVNPAGPGRAFFRIQGGALQATTDPTGTWKTCNEATTLPNDGFALPYRCLFHQLQNGVVVVSP